MGFIKDLFYEKLGCNTCDAPIRKGKGHPVSGSIADNMVRDHYRGLIAKYRTASDMMNMSMRVDLRRGTYLLCDKCFAEFEQLNLNHLSAPSDKKPQTRCLHLFDAGNYGGIQYWCENSNSPGTLGQGSRIPLSDGNQISRYCLGDFARCALYIRKD